MADYVVRRLRDECASRRGAAKEISERTRISVSHISHIRAGRRSVGTDVIEALAQYWRMSYQDLEAVALESHRSGARVESRPNLVQTIEWCRGDGWSDAFLRDYEARARREQPSDKSWQEWLTDIKAAHRRWEKDEAHGQKLERGSPMEKVKDDGVTRRGRAAEPTNRSRKRKRPRRRRDRSR